MVSVFPPGGNGTMTVTGRVGHVAARADKGDKPLIATSPARPPSAARRVGSPFGAHGVFVKRPPLDVMKPSPIVMIVAQSKFDATWDR
jgi:hypothetical protein